MPLRDFLALIRSLFAIERPRESLRKGDLAGLCWSERRDLNSGPPVPQTGALTGLRYAPTDAEIISLTRIGRNTFRIVEFRDCPLRQCP